MMDNARCRATTRDRPYYATKPPVKPPVILAFGGEMTLHCTFYLIRQQSPAEANTRERGVCWGPFTLSPGQRSPDPGREASPPAPLILVGDFGYQSYLFI